MGIRSGPCIRAGSPAHDNKYSRKFLVQPDLRARRWRGHCRATAGDATKLPRHCALGCTVDHTHGRSRHLSRTKARDLLQKNGYIVETYADALAFIVSYRPSRRGCLLVEATMPGINGIELIRRLQDAGDETSSNHDFGSCRSADCPSSDAGRCSRLHRQAHPLRRATCQHQTGAGPGWDCNKSRCFSPLGCRSRCSVDIPAE